MIQRTLKICVLKGNDSSSFKTLCIKVYDLQRRVKHDKIQTLTKFKIPPHGWRARWITRANVGDVPLLPWHPGRQISLNGISSIEVTWWTKFLFLLMPTTLQAGRITAALANIDRSMLSNVWTELDYRWDSCRVT